jgi:hypothetical protein
MFAASGMDVCGFGTKGRMFTRSEAETKKYDGILIVMF